jgi:hypothetical protein
MVTTATWRKGLLHPCPWLHQLMFLPSPVNYWKYSDITLLSIYSTNLLHTLLYIPVTGKFVPVHATEEY